MKALLYKIIIRLTPIEVYKGILKGLNKIKVFNLIVISFYLKE